MKLSTFLFPLAACVLVAALPAEPIKSDLTLDSGHTALSVESAKSDITFGSRASADLDAYDQATTDLELLAEADAEKAVEQRDDAKLDMCGTCWVQLKLCMEVSFRALPHGSPSANTRQFSCHRQTWPPAPWLTPVDCKAYCMRYGCSKNIRCGTCMDFTCTKGEAMGSAEVEEIDGQLASEMPTTTEEKQ